MDSLAAFRDANPRFFEEEFLQVYCGAGVGTQLLIGLRASCHAWRAAIPAPKPCALRDLIRDVARAGDLDACCAIRDHVARESFSIDDMLIGAAEGGHEHICRFAHDLDTSGKCQYGAMGGAAAKIGNANLCKIAREWEERDTIGYGLSDWAMYDGARAGHLHICELVWSWNQKCISSMRSGAASGGHVHVMKRALELSGDDASIDWHDLMKSVVGSGRADICWFIHEKSGRSAKCDISMLAGLMREWFEGEELSDVIDTRFMRALEYGDQDTLRLLHAFSKECKCCCNWRYVLHKSRGASRDMFRLGCQMMIEDLGEDNINWRGVIIDAARIGDIETVEMALAQYKRHPRKLHAPW
jgi:hypothetical protein